MSETIDKSKLAALVMEEINKAIEDGTLINEGTRIHESYQRN